ncbi:hypothetical protein F383_11189 [Gossypium arboreum]|uniref:Uncharacterized protein n=1 Tax=Gossypium arboreum TaxID=29729 RepID=A0A0B0NEI0_GOSAR|nr:hypothetical protein F383_11189 [Gossypium arboreum]
MIYLKYECLMDTLLIGTFELMDICKYGMYRLVINMIVMVT